MNYDLSPRLRSIMALDPSAPALQNRGKWLTWGDLASIGDDLQCALNEIGVPGTVRVGMIMRNRVGFVASVLSVLAHRQTVVTMNSMLPDEQLAKDFSGIPVQVVIGDRQDWARPGIREAARASGITALAVDDTGIEILERGRGNSIEDEGIDPDTAVLMLTSGTTGPPKRICLTYKAYSSAFSSITSAGGEEVRLRRGVGILFSPLLHVSGMFALLNSTLAGRKLALMERFKVDEWVELVREHRPAVLALPPTALQMVLDAGVDPDDLSYAQATMVGSAPLSVEVARVWEERYGVPVLMNYGATEFAGGIVGWNLAEHREFGESKRGSSGRAHTGVELRIVSEETFEILGVNEVGLLEVRSHQVAGNTWTRTSDRARIDTDGFLWVIGRADDVIIRGGFKVSTGSVSEAIKTHPGVRDAAVIGVDDVRLGKVPVAAIERTAGSLVSAGEILTWVRERLTPYQVPVSVHFFDELPRTPSMKVSTPALRELLVQVGVN